MHITQQESHDVSVLAGQGELVKLRKAVHSLAERESASPADILIACKDDFQQTAAHMAAKGGQVRMFSAILSDMTCRSHRQGSIETLAELLGNEDKKVEYFNMANRFTGDRPAHTAMRNGYLDVFKTLVRHGADPTVKNRFGDAVTDYPGDYSPEEVQAVIDEYNERIARGPK